MPCTSTDRGKQSEPANTKNWYEVAISGLPLLLTYSFEGTLVVGTRVTVPLRNQIRTGFVWRQSSKPETYKVSAMLAPASHLPAELPHPASKALLLASIWQNPDLFTIPEATVQFLDWAASYYGLAVGTFLHQALPSPLLPESEDGYFAPDPATLPDSLLKKATVQNGCTWFRARTSGLTPEIKKKLLRIPLLKQDRIAADHFKSTSLLWGFKPSNPKQSAAVSLLLRDSGASRKEVATIYADPEPFIKRMLTGGFIRPAVPVSLQANGPDLKPLVELNKEQLLVIDSVSSYNKYQGILLQGVTGSGKTEVYAHLAQHHLEQGHQVLLLAPEIGLATQLHQRLKKHFGTKALLFHSDLPAGARRTTCNRCASGEPLLLIGTRSALFMPLPGLKIICVDEEHESAYKAPDDPYIHGRNLAVKLAHQFDCPVVLGSATPSLESWHHAQSGRYRHVRLDHSVAKALVNYKIVAPTSAKARAKLIADSLREQIGQALDAGEQVALLKNRRGRFRQIQCSSCGWQAECPNCDLNLVEHKHPRNHLSCHICGYKEDFPENCPSCKAPRFRRSGEGTQHWEEQLDKLWPKAEIIRIDGDMGGGYDRWSTLYNKIANGQNQILIGTQMIAKGFDLPNLHTMVATGVDGWLAVPEVRAWEKAFVLLRQAAGRVGRREREGQFWIETNNADHPVIQAIQSNQTSSFLDSERDRRKHSGFPPWRRAANIIFEHDARLDARQLRKHLEAVSRQYPVEIFGPVEDTVVRRSGRFIATALALSNDIVQLHKMCESVRSSSNIRVRINYDPVDPG